MRPAPIWAISAAARSMALTCAPMSAPHGRGLEVRALEHDGRARRRHFGCRATHHAGNRLCAVAIGDHEHVGIELPLDVVERDDALASFRAPYPNLGTRKLRDRTRASAGRFRDSRSW